MAAEETSPFSLPRDPIKASVHNRSARRRREHAVAIGKEKREALLRAKRRCRSGVFGGDGSHDGGEEVSMDDEIAVEEEGGVLDAQALQLVAALKSVSNSQGKCAAQKKVDCLRDLRRLLSKSESPPLKAVLQAGAVPLLVKYLSFGTPEDQLVEAAWCLTNMAAGDRDDTEALLPAIPLLVAHLGEKSSLSVAEQCAWALGNVAGEGEDFRDILLAQGALLPLARFMMNNKSSIGRTAAWTLSNLIKGPNPRAASELIKIDGVLDAIIRHLKQVDDELTTEVAWVVVYLSALSETAIYMLVKRDAVQLLVGRLVTSENLQLLIPILRSLGNIVAGVSSINDVLPCDGNSRTVGVLSDLLKCMRSEHRVLKKEALWVISNIAAGSLEHKRAIYSSEARQLLLHLLSSATFDIRKEVAHVLGNLCVAPPEDPAGGRPKIILDHLVSLVRQGCLPGFVNLVRSPDIEAARLGLQFLELVLRGMPNGEGPRIVEREGGIDAMERFQFHENEEMRLMANGLVDRYFGEDYVS